MTYRINFGLFCEKQAEIFLLSKGYKILKRRYRYKRAEIDLIAKKENLIIFIEVKGRKDIGFGNPENFVDENKCKLIIKAAEQFIFSENLSENIRFDIISIVGTFGKYKLFHIEDAFY